MSPDKTAAEWFYYKMVTVFLPWEHGGGGGGGWRLFSCPGSTGGTVFQGSHPVAGAYNGLCSLKTLSMDT